MASRPVGQEGRCSLVVCFLFSLSRFYKRSQLYIVYSDDSLDKCQTKSFGKYETSASGYLMTYSFLYVK